MFVIGCRFFGINTSVLYDKSAAFIKMDLTYGGIKQISSTASKVSHKVTVVGVGQVGMACAFSILTQNVSHNVVLVDVMKDKLVGEFMDLQHGSMFLRNAKIQASTDYAVTAGSELCIITAGVRQKEGESRLNLVQRNTEMFKDIIPQLVKYSPDTILLVVSNPVDILTYVSWKLSGLPSNKVIGSGTNLDSSRFRFLLSEKFKIAPTSCHGCLIGEHGDSCVPVWSGVNIAGVHLKDLLNSSENCDETEGLPDLYQKVVQSADEVIKLKGYTSWAVALSVTSIAYAILKDSGTVHLVSTVVKGFHGIQEDVYLSLPCSLGNMGIRSIIKQKLNSNETALLQKSASLLSSVQKNIKL